MARKLGNCFLTKEEAEFKLQRRIIKTQLLKLGESKEKDFLIKQYCLGYDSRFCQLNIYNFINFAYQGAIWFNSKENYENAIRVIGEDKIEKYLFSEYNEED